ERIAAILLSDIILIVSNGKEKNSISLRFFITISRFIPVQIPKVLLIFLEYSITVVASISLLPLDSSLLLEPYVSFKSLLSSYISSNEGALINNSPSQVVLINPRC